MRIPSQFNEDSLYRRRPNRSDNSDASRRLIRLILGLVLVLVVMRQAARPEIYQAFFGTPPEQGPVAPSLPSATSDHEFLTGDLPQAAAAATSDAVEITPADRWIATRLTESLLASDRRQWMRALSRWKAGRTVQQVPSTIESIRDLLSDETLINEALADQDASIEIDAERLAQWQSTLDTLERDDRSSDSDRGSEPQRSVVTAWLETLDQAAAEQVVDGSTWRSGDFGLFYRYLDQAPELSAANTAAMGVVPLLQQPEVYRNRRVRVAGRVARCERFDAQPNAFDIDHYYQLWLRPSDGADRPLVAIVPEVPEIISNVGPDAVETNGPSITLVGRYLKRLAYRSQKGADLAPVVVGRLLTAPVLPAESAATESTEPQSFGQRWLILALACLLGVATAVIAMWRTGLTARRSRELRNAHRPPPDLNFVEEPSANQLDSSSPNDAT